MLVIDDGTRTRPYCLLLLKSEDVDRNEALAHAEIYGVKEIVSDLFSYLDTEGRKRADRLPTWDGFCEPANEYGVPV